MKKYIASLLCVLLIISCLCGCAPTTHPIETAPENATTPSTETIIPTEPQQPTEPESTEPQETTPTETPGKFITPLEEVDDNTMVNVSDYIPDAIVDLKYSTTDNFTGQQIYEADMPAQLRAGTVKKLVRAQETFREVGYTIVIWDAYRPVAAQFKLWDIYPDANYVANPNTGYSSHSKGNTVDITLAYSNGELIAMPTEFDDFSAAADRDYSEFIDSAPNRMLNAQFLETVMKQNGFTPYSAEWWHFTDTQNYDIVK